MGKVFTQRRSGLTLVEVVIAVFLLGMCISGACALVLHTKKLNDVARAHYVAANIARNRLERARTIDFTALSLLAEYDVVVDHNGNPDPNGNYSRSTAVTNVKANLAEVSVTVGIRNRVSGTFKGEDEIVTTFIADYVEPEE